MTKKTNRQTSTDRELLEYLSSGPKLAAQITYPARTVGRLYQAGLIEQCEDATVRGPGGVPAVAYRLTQAGKDRLASNA